LVLVYIDAVAHLIGSNLRVNPYFIQEAGMGPAHSLEVYPLKAYRLETGQETAPPAVVLQKGVVIFSEGNTHDSGAPSGSLC
jgi:hypothetical protein